MTKIYMLSTQRGSEDGFAVKRYHEAKHYDMPHTLGAHFINQGWAIEIPEEDYLSTATVVNKLPNPAMQGFNANAEARKSEGL